MINVNATRVSSPFIVPFSVQGMDKNSSILSSEISFPNFLRYGNNFSFRAAGFAPLPQVSFQSLGKIQTALNVATLGALLLVPSTAQAMDFSVIQDPATWIYMGGAVIGANLLIAAARALFSKSKSAPATKETSRSQFQKNEIHDAVKQTIQLAHGAANYSLQNQILISFAEEHVSEINLDQAFDLADNTGSYDAADKILDAFYKANFQTLTCAQIIKCAQRSTTYAKQNAILLHAARNRDDLTAAELQTMSQNTGSYDATNELIKIAANVVKKKPLAKPEPQPEPKTEQDPNLDELYGLGIKELAADKKRDALIAIIKKIWAVSGSDIRRTHLSALVDDPLETLRDGHYRLPVILEIAQQLGNDSKEIRDDAAWILSHIAVKVELTEKELKDLTAAASDFLKVKNQDVNVDTQRFLEGWNKRVAARSSVTASANAANNDQKRKAAARDRATEK